jgi:molybdopterin adenylyltransferase
VDTERAPERELASLRVGILTVSDTRTLETDSSGALLEERARTAGHTVVAREIVKDERALIAARFRSWMETCDVIISTGGTGITGRDVTPEAVRDVCTKEIPGFGELFRYLSFATIGTATIQSRAIGAVAGSTLIFALPGSSGACRDAWDQILLDQLDVNHKPCNFAELLPRLNERQ